MNREDLISKLSIRFKELTKEGKLQYFYDYSHLANEVLSVLENSKELQNVNSDNELNKPAYARR